MHSLLAVLLLGVARAEYTGKKGYLSLCGRLLRGIVGGLLYYVEASWARVGQFSVTETGSASHSECVGCGGAIVRLCMRLGTESLYLYHGTEVFMKHEAQGQVPRKFMYTKVSCEV